ncbi:hypothetical protein Aduo_016563 [Ancylostoma duodenale]
MLLRGLPATSSLCYGNGTVGVLVEAFAVRGDDGLRGVAFMVESSETHVDWDEHREINWTVSPILPLRLQPDLTCTT